MTHSGIGLARVVVVAPRRRLELALPEQAPLATLLPAVLRHAGEDLTEEGLSHDGWVLRRVDGAILEPGSTLAAQRVLDGETLYLAPRRTGWPEPVYDDVVDAIAASAARRGLRWSAAATRVTGLSVACVALAAGLARTTLAGPPWPVTAALALGIGTLLTLTGIALSRVLADAPAGATVAAGGLPYLFVGGLTLFAEESLLRIGAPHLLTGSALVLAAGVLGHVGVAAHERVFVASSVAGACGVIGGAMSYGPLDSDSAALLTGLLLLAGPALPAVAVRLGRIPLPELPRAPTDLVADAPLPDRHSLSAATARADEMLTGLLLGTAVVTVTSMAVLAGTATGSAVGLVGVVSLAHLLRARFYAALRHRVPLLATGIAGLALLTVTPAALEPPDQMRSLVVVPALTGVAAIALAAGLRYSRRPPSPRLGRAADILDVVLTLAVVPLCAGILGLFGFMRGLGG